MSEWWIPETPALEPWLTPGFVLSYRWPYHMREQEGTILGASLWGALQR